MLCFRGCLLYVDVHWWLLRAHLHGQRAVHRGVLLHGAGSGHAARRYVVRYVEHLQGEQRVPLRRRPVGRARVTCGLGAHAHAQQLGARPRRHGWAPRPRAARAARRRGRTRRWRPTRGPARRPPPAGSSPRRRAAAWAWCQVKIGRASQHQGANNIGRDDSVFSQNFAPAERCRPSRWSCHPAPGASPTCLLAAGLAMNEDTLSSQLRKKGVSSR